MPSKDKKRKKKSKKPRMTTEEVLKLLKKLRPKTQQTVRVNVGTGDAKSKKDLSSYTPPFVYPGFQQQAVVAPAPLQPPAPPPQAAALPYSQQTQLQPWIIPSSSSLPPPPPLARAPSYITDVESGVEIPIKVRRSRKKAEEAEQGYSVSAPTGPRAFTAPRTTRTSQLAAQAAEPLRFSEPAVNDPFLPYAPVKEQFVDQIGNEPAGLPSDQWTGTPSGEEQPLADITASAAAELPPVEPPRARQEATAAGTEVWNLAFEEESAPEQYGSSTWGEAELEPVPPPTPPKAETRPALSVPSYYKQTATLMKEELDRAFRLGYPKDEFPQSWFNTKGSTKGNLKSTGIKIGDLTPYYDKFKQEETSGQWLGSQPYRTAAEFRKK